MEEYIIKHKDNFYLKTEVGYKKIILTTNKLLIKDGVQPIDDEFLQWFVQNPSCENVKVEPDYDEVRSDYYKIVIPSYIKSETKFIGVEFDLADGFSKFISKEEPKQETLEEVANKANGYNVYSKETKAPIFNEGFVVGAKWQQNREYSNLQKAIKLLESTTEYEILEEFREKVKKLTN